MKVQLIVMQGKPEGKTIPLLGPRFKIGRGETCHLRPNSEQVSREHAEFTVAPTGVSVADLGSRNGTLVNGRVITGPTALKDADLVQVGPLTFAVSIQGAPAEVAKPAAPKTAKSSLDDVSNDEIDSWLVADGKKAAAPESPSGVYGGDTITIAAFTSVVTAAKSGPPAAPVAPTQAPDDSDEGYERLESSEEDADSDDDDDNEDDENADPNPSDMPEDLIDESNPFYVKKNKPQDPNAPAPKPVYKDTSDAAQDILRKMMERRKQK